MGSENHIFHNALACFKWEVHTVYTKDKRQQCFRRAHLGWMFPEQVYCLRLLSVFAHFYIFIYPHVVCWFLFTKYLLSTVFSLNDVVVIFCMFEEKLLNLKMVTALNCLSMRFTENGNFWGF